MISSYKKIYDRINIFTPDGVFNGDSRSEDFRLEVLEKIDGFAQPQVILNLCQVKWFQSNFIGKLNFLLDEIVKNRRGILKIVADKDSKAYKIFEISGFIKHETYDFYTNLEKAVDSFRGV